MNRLYLRESTPELLPVPGVSLHKNQLHSTIFGNDLQRKSVACYRFAGDSLPLRHQNGVLAIFPPPLLNGKKVQKVSFSVTFSIFSRPC